MEIQAQCNFAGYGRFGGSRATAEELAKLFESMEQNGLLLCERLLTGQIVAETYPPHEC